MLLAFMLQVPGYLITSFILQLVVELHISHLVERIPWRISSLCIDR